MIVLCALLLSLRLFDTLVVVLARSAAVASDTFDEVDPFVEVSEAYLVTEGSAQICPVVLTYAKFDSVTALAARTS